MELSQEIQTILQKYRPHKLPQHTNDDYLIDVADMAFDNETWLVASNPVADLTKFFKSDTDMMTSSDSDTSNETYKQFDSRTFTRPKRNFTRPSIEKYNEEFFASSTKPSKVTLSEEIDNYMSISNTTIEDGMTEKTKPVHFDLTQPISTSIFENIASQSAEMDSFQNMSPPSLVNSMCSSTFTNLMDNSFIKNDPVLREIRDADYSAVIYQEMEPPLYQSITESCSSINTEVAETFVRKTLNSLNCTFNKRLDQTPKYVSDGAQLHAENIDPNSTYSALNGTYRKNKTFTDEDDLSNDQIANATFQLKQEIIVSDKESDEWNSTFSVQEESPTNNTLNATFRRSKSPKPATLNSTFNKNHNVKANYGSAITIVPQIDNYMIDDNRTKRLSDEIDDYLKQKISFYSESEDNPLMNRSTNRSTDSLDRLSSLSNSSRDSKLMADVDAIVEAQERSLQQVMSTPKPKSLAKPFSQLTISPIPNLNLKEHLSDSELSSGEYNTVRSRFSDQQSAKSLNNLKYVESIPRKSVHTVSDMQRPASGLRRPSTAGRASGLRKESKISGSYGNLRQISSNFGSSYTNLRPKSMVLPNIPAKSGGDEFKVPHAVPKTTDTHRNYASNPNDTFAKPKVTNLPRPTGGTGIPRPTSKIPGPRTSRLPLARSNASSRTNLSDGNY
ncbi:uncharacterized protein [Atheta coriaria]|uniref:uncharacterized protein n=1 Tax=Dalotia coriaria TaxID=877792 RepID=UPI0031F3E5DA